MQFKCKYYEYRLSARDGTQGIQLRALSLIDELILASYNKLKVFRLDV